MLFRTVKQQLIRLILGRESIELAYWNAYNREVEEALYINENGQNIVTNFHSDHNGFGLDPTLSKSQLLKALVRVGDRKGSAEQNE